MLEDLSLKIASMLLNINDSNDKLLTDKAVCLAVCLPHIAIEAVTGYNWFTPFLPS